MSSNTYEFSVSEISGSIKKTIETKFDDVRIRGEISGYRGPHSSGHAYFSLKDEKARIEAVVWRGVFSKLKVRPEEGMEVIATGKITTYPGSSKYQIVIQSIEPAGVGAMMAMLEERKKRLTNEGLFEAERKQLLPYMPKVIGVVTSPTGAVIHDILHRISDRFPVHVVLWPVRVQGETSGDEVANAINGFNSPENTSIFTKPDLIIVARGGGSFEDLWGFNDEAVIRAAANSDIPLISAVGHETDWTLLDLVCDQRAPTPTGAAEMAVPVKAELEAQIAELSARLQSAKTRLFDRRREQLAALVRALPSLATLLALPNRRLDEAASNLDKTIQLNQVQRARRFEKLASSLTPDRLKTAIAEKKLILNNNWSRLENLLNRKIERLGSRIENSDNRLFVALNQMGNMVSRKKQSLHLAFANQDKNMKRIIDVRLQRVNEANRLLTSLSYTNVMKRGYAIIRDANDQVLTKAQQMSSSERISIELSDARVNAVVGDHAMPDIVKKTKPVVKTKVNADKVSSQGKLF